VERVIQGQMIVFGTARGRVVLSQVPISLWGGVDPKTGTIIDRRHDRCGADVSGRIFAFPEGKGSSTASAVLVELVRNGHAPAAIVTREVPPVVALGSIVARELYKRSVPVVVVDAAGFGQLEDGAYASIEADGSICITSDEPSH
jgi:predicted aconitase with swiveling domain